MKIRSAFIAALVLFLSLPRLAALPDETECSAFLEAHPHGNVSREFLQKNIRLALAGIQNRPWKNSVPDEIFLTGVLPYSSAEETPEFWRERFLGLLSPLVKDCETPTETAEKLNDILWDLLDVHYSPLRDKPDQSPSHSERIHKASCTGLSILLIDACRAVGVPARMISCVWPHKPGNHSWVEIYDNGNWLRLGAGDGGKAGSAWFDDDAARCENAPRENRIYALSWTGTTLAPLPWNPRKCVPAIDVTENYAKKFSAGTPLCVSVIDKNKQRIAVKIRVRERASGTILVEEILTHDNRFDLNDHLKIPGVPAGTEIIVETCSGEKLVPVKTTVPNLLLFERQNETV